MTNSVRTINVQKYGEAPPLPYIYSTFTVNVIMVRVKSGKKQKTYLMNQSMFLFQVKFLFKVENYIVTLLTTEAEKVFLNSRVYAVGSARCKGWQVPGIAAKGAFLPGISAEENGISARYEKAKWHGRRRVRRCRRWRNLSPTLKHHGIVIDT
jgi:hypothetical protein